MREVAAAGASCSFHRIDGKNLTKAAFEKLYREKEPVLLEGLLERWPATLEWTKPKLLHLYGERKMQVYSNAVSRLPYIVRLAQTGSGSAIVYGGGSGGAGTTLRSRLEMMGSENYSVEDNIFTFDVSFFKYRFDCGEHPLTTQLQGCPGAHKALQHTIHFPWV
jgi:hypothetical protein